MRFLKRLIIAVLVYIAVYLPFIAILQAVSGGDFTAAYSVGGIVGAVELALGSVIKVIRWGEEILFVAGLLVGTRNLIKW